MEAQHNMKEMKKIKEELMEKVHKLKSVLSIQPPKLTVALMEHM